jgi:hypothetical protein
VKILLRANKVDVGSRHCPHMISTRIKKVQHSSLQKICINTPAPLTFKLGLGSFGASLFEAL